MSTRSDKSGGFSCATKSPVLLFSYFLGSVSLSTNTTLLGHRNDNTALTGASIAASFLMSIRADRYEAVLALPLPTLNFRHRQHMSLILYSSLQHLCHMNAYDSCALRDLQTCGVSNARLPGWFLGASCPEAEVATHSLPSAAPLAVQDLLSHPLCRSQRISRP